MNTIRRKIELLTVAMLGMLGLVDAQGLYVAYGCPHVKLTIKGKVTNRCSIPVKGIEVRVLEGEETEGKAVRTDKKGQFELDQTFDYGREKGGPVRVVLTDVDGCKHGSYETDTVEIAFPEVVHDEKNAWRWIGTAEAGKIKLRK